MTPKERQWKNQMLQATLADAQRAVDEAKALADELETPFEFLGRTYTPLSGGKFDHEFVEENNWDSSNDDGWYAS